MTRIDTEGNIQATTESFFPETLAADFYPCSSVSSVVKLNPATGNCMIRVCHLFTSPGHNFVGHHGGPPGEHAVVESDEVECVADRGIRGDRYFDFKENYKGQVTFFSLEAFDAMRRELHLPEARPADTRRNVFVSGTDLLSLVGKEFEIQGVRFHGVEECRPCYWMNRAFGHELAEGWLKGRGGLRARILTGGMLRRDAVT